MKIEQAVEDFLLYLKYEKGYSNNTFSSYNIDLAQLIKWSKVKDTDSFTLSHINEYLLQMKRRGFEKKTLTRKLSSLSSFINYLLKKGIIKENLKVFLDFPRQNRRLPKTVSKETIKKMRGQKMKKFYVDEMVYLRDRAMMALMYGCGLRVSEVANLSVKDVDLTRRTLRIFGKGEKERVVPIAEVICEKTNEFAIAWKEIVRTGFFTKKNGSSLTRQRIWEIIKDWKRHLDIQEKISPHMLRHTFATLLLENDIDLRFIQEMLGHSNISTTEIYTAVNTGRLHDVYRKAHPRS